MAKTANNSEIVIIPPRHDGLTGSAVFGTTTDTGSDSPYFLTSTPRGSVRKKKIKRTKDVTAAIVTDMIIDFCNEHGDLVTNLQLQKLLYFAQGWYLALHGKPLFQDTLLAWPSGPIQFDVYSKYRRFGAEPIRQPMSQWEVPKTIQKFVNELMEVYVGFSSFELQRIACSETPWQEARIGLEADEPSNNPIDIDALKKTYIAKANG